MGRVKRLYKLARWLHLPHSSALTCPHCLAPVGGVENVCPSCRRILRFEGIAELRARSDRTGGT